MSTPFVARIDLYPIKGFDAVPVDAATVLPSGALAGDRRWAFVDGRDRFVNGKQFPAIHRIRTTIDPDASTAVFDDLPLPPGRRRDAARGLDVRAAGDAGPAAGEPARRLPRRHRLAGADADRDGHARGGRRLVRPDARADARPLPRQHRDRRRAGVLGGCASTAATCRHRRRRRSPARVVLVNPCARCVVPSRDARTGEPIAGFQKRFAEQRRATLAAGVDPTPFNHYYRLAVNTRLAPGSTRRRHPRRRCGRRRRPSTAGAVSLLTRMVGFVTTTSPERAKAFYAEVRSASAFSSDDGFALSFDAHGTLLRVAKAQSFTPAQATVLGWEVADIAGAVRELGARGVRFEQFNLPFLSPGRARHLDRAQRRPRRLVQGSGRQHPVPLMPPMPAVTAADRLRELTALLESIAADRARPRRSARGGARPAAAGDRPRLQPGSLCPAPPVEGRAPRPQGVAGRAARPAQGHRRRSARCTASRR